uniref:Uncharacterized protein n=1 Tax=Arundo donax TaxID=35708 RepID=A0A0A9AGI5_ARUDO
MSSSAGGRRLVVLIRRIPAGTNRFQPQAARLPHHYYSSTPLLRAPDLDAASYLVASYGLTPAALASRGVRFHSAAAKADAVLALLRSYGFSNADVARMLPKTPNLLILDPDKIVGPKLEFFVALGVRAAVLAQTNLLGRSLEKRIVPSVKFLRGILGTDASIGRAVSSNPTVLELDLEKKSRPAVEALHRHGLTEKAISGLLVIQSGILRMAPNRIAGIFEDLEVLGLPIADSRFARAFVAMCRLKRETARRRLALYQSFGLSESQVSKAFMIRPMILGLSDETIQRKLLFFRNELKIALPQVITYPKALAFSLEKNILPKCAVLSVLMRSGKIQRHKFAWS